MKKKILQKIADAIYNRLEATKTKKDFDMWFNIGMKLDTWCVDRNIWLA